MKFYPSIDIQAGQCVRLKQGAFTDKTVYGEDLKKIVLNYQQAGCSYLHLVDLDGAKEGIPQQADLIIEIAKQTTLTLQVGGGIRTEAAIENYLSQGIARVVVGSLAVTNPTLFKKWLAHFGGDRLVLACDVRYEENNPYIATQGWQEQSDKTLWQMLDSFSDADLTFLLCTDIFCDGMLLGPNVKLYQEIKRNFPKLQIQASGGITTLENIKALDDLELEGFIVGKAIYENHLALESLQPWF